MTYEAVKAELYGENSSGKQVRYYYSGTSMATKGELMCLSGGTTNTSLRYCTNSLAEGDPIVGIAAHDCSGTCTDLAVWTDGIFSMTCSGTVKPGDGVFSISQTGSENWIMSTSGTNLIRYAARESGCPVMFGYALTYNATEGGTADVKLVL